MTLPEMRVVVGLPESGSDEEIARALALKGGLKEPTNPKTVKYLVTLIQVAHDNLVEDGQRLGHEMMVDSYTAVRAPTVILGWGPPDIAEIEADLGIEEDGGLEQLYGFQLFEPLSDYGGLFDTYWPGEPDRH